MHLPNQIVGHLPVAFVSRLRDLYRRYNKARVERLPKLEASEFKHILTDRLGVHAGDVVFVHSSVGQLAVAAPVSEILALLKEAVGPEGTIIFPTFPKMGSYEFLRTGQVFDARQTPSYMGILTELARRRRDAVRSLHPTKSVCAIGPVAKALTEDHGQSPYPYDSCSPYYRTMTHGGKIIGLGVSTSVLSFVHCVEDAMKDRFPVDPYHPELFAAVCHDYSGQTVIVPTYAHDLSKMRHRIPQLMKRYVSPEICEDVIMKGRHFFRCDAKRLFDRMVALAAEGHTIYPRSVYRKPTRSKP